MRTVLFLCTHNSARSQMAEGFVNSRRQGAWRAESAGIEPRGVHPMAVAAMAEAGIDISGHRSKPLGEMDGRRFDVVATVCDGARDACPFFPGGRMVHRAFPDPSAASGTEEERMAAFRSVRDAIAAWTAAEFREG